MVKLRALWSNSSGTSAAEFGLVLPLLTLLLYGTVEAGRFMWESNRAEKATQVGARMAVVTDIISPGVASTGYVGQTIGGVTLTAGDRIPASALGDVTCDQSGCTCTTTPCPTLGTADTTRFNDVVTRMQYMLRQIDASNVTIEYHGSGLGFAGDPNGSEMSPLVTVKLTNVPFRPLTWFSVFSLTLPSFTTTLTGEDLSGSESY